MCLLVCLSRFYHQIIPAQFDAAVAVGGGPKVRSFNLACDALWPPESYYFLRKILALHSSRLHSVVIEMMDINPMIDEANKDSLRESYWRRLSPTPEWPGTLLGLLWQLSDTRAEPTRSPSRTATSITLATCGSTDLLEAHPWLRLIQPEERRAAAMKGELALMHGGFLLNQWVKSCRAAQIGWETCWATIDLR